MANGFVVRSKKYIINTLQQTRLHISIPDLRCAYEENEQFSAHSYIISLPNMNTISVQLKRTLLKIGAGICIGLGLIGAFLPVLPTTPFLLLATALSYNASPKMRRWLLEHPVFGGTIRNYFESRSITVTALKRALVTLWLGLALSIWLISSVWVNIILLITGASVTWYLLRLKRTA